MPIWKGIPCAERGAPVPFHNQENRPVPMIRAEMTLFSDGGLSPLVLQLQSPVLSRMKGVRSLFNSIALRNDTKEGNCFLRNRPSNNGHRLRIPFGFLRSIRYSRRNSRLSRKRTAHTILTPFAYPDRTRLERSASELQNRSSNHK